MPNLLSHTHGSVEKKYSNTFPKSWKGMQLEKQMIMLSAPKTS